MNKTKIKIAAISDLHGMLPTIEESADILLIAGDVIPLAIQFNKVESMKWFETTFAEWILSVPVEDVYMVAGNHDAYLESANKTKIGKILQATNFKLHYLENTDIVYRNCDGVEFKIFGTPYCHRYGTWPFMRDDEYMEEKFKQIPEDVDIIISHDPPYGLCDADVILEDTRNLGRGLQHLGNVPLAQRIVNIPYKLHVCGHIHSGDHNLVRNTANVSLCNENYSGVYPVFYTEIEKEYE